MAMFYKGNRALQDRFDGRRIADRLVETRRRETFNDEDRDLIESLPFFFLATAHDGVVDCSFKGGMPGFVRLTGANTLEFPDYDGNSMYKSLGNLAASPSVGLLFIRFEERRARLRVNGRARLIHDPARVNAVEGARQIVEVTAEHIFPNCPRYIPEMAVTAPSDYAPRPGHHPPQPEWKHRDYLRDYIPERDKAEVFGALDAEGEEER